MNDEYFGVGTERQGLQDCKCLNSLGPLWQPFWKRVMSCSTGEVITTASCQKTFFFSLSSWQARHGPEARLVSGHLKKGHEKETHSTGDSTLRSISDL